MGHCSEKGWLNSLDSSAEYSLYEDSLKTGDTFTKVIQLREGGFWVYENGLERSVQEPHTHTSQLRATAKRLTPEVHTNKRTTYSSSLGTAGVAWRYSCG